MERAPRNADPCCAGSPMASKTAFAAWLAPMKPCSTGCSSTGPARSPAFLRSRSPRCSSTRSSAATSFRPSTRGSSASTSGARRARGSSRRRSTSSASRTTSARSSRPAELDVINDNIGLPNNINLALSDSVTAGPSDGEILVALNATHRPTAGYLKTLRDRVAAAVSRSRVLHPAGGHRQPDSQLRACPRRSTSR